MEVEPLSTPSLTVPVDATATLNTPPQRTPPGAPVAAHRQRAFNGGSTTRQTALDLIQSLDYSDSFGDGAQLSAASFEGDDNEELHEELDTLDDE